MEKKTLTMRNAILKRVFCLFVPPIYLLLCKGCRNEDCRYASLLLAMEVVSFILDLLGGSHWGYLLASFLLSVLILQTTIDAYFIKRSRIKSEAQQLIAMEIVSSLLQLIISCYCLIRTLSGVKTNYSSSVFPLAHAIISVVFAFKSKKDVSHPSSDTPPDTPDQFGITVGPSDTPVDNVDPSDPSLVSVPTSDANVDPLDSTLVSLSTSDGKVDPLDPTLVSLSTSDAKNDPLDPTLVSLSTSDSKINPLEPELVSMTTSYANVPEASTLRQRKQSAAKPTSDPKVDPPLDLTPVSGPKSSAKVPQASMLSQHEQSAFKKLVLKVDVHDDKAKKKALMRTVSGISGVHSIQMDMKEKKLTLIGYVDPIHVVATLRKQCSAEILSVGPAEERKTNDEKQPKKDKALEINSTFSVGTVGRMLEEWRKVQDE